MAQQELKTCYLLLGADSASTDISVRAYENYANAYDDMESDFKKLKKKTGTARAEINDYAASVFNPRNDITYYWNIKKITV